MSRATIVFISRFAHSWSTETHVARDAEAIGCNVHCIAEDRVGQALARGENPEIPECDLVLYMKADGLPGHAGLWWKALERQGVKTASYHLDLYYGLDRQSQIGNDPFWQTGTVFTADGDPRALAYMRERGVNHRWLPAAIVSDECRAGHVVQELVHDVVFVGSTGAYHRQWPWRQQLLVALDHRYGDRFRAYGHGSKPKMRDFRLNDLYASARVVVGDSLALPGHRNYWSDRYYETIGRGGLLVAPHVDGLDEHFARGAHYLAYRPGDVDDLFGAIDVALDMPHMGETIRLVGREHVAAHHTYRHRVEQLLTEVGL